MDNVNSLIFIRNRLSTRGFGRVTPSQVSAEAEGFEPSVRFPGQHISSVLHSTALPRLRIALPYTKKAQGARTLMIKNMELHRERPLHGARAPLPVILA